MVLPTAYTKTRTNDTHSKCTHGLQQETDKMKRGQRPYDSPVGIGSGFPPRKSQESIFHSNQREKTDPMEYTSILYCFGVPGPKPNA